ncbi:unnamed protein product [Urochloa humidicola]
MAQRRAPASATRPHPLLASTTYYRALSLAPPMVGDSAPAPAGSPSSDIEDPPPLGGLPPPANPSRRGGAPPVPPPVRVPPPLAHVPGRPGTGGIIRGRLDLHPPPPRVRRHRAAAPPPPLEGDEGPSSRRRRQAGDDDEGSSERRDAPAKPEEIYEALRVIPGLAKDVLLKAYSKLLRDDRQFRSLMALPANMRKDWLLMEIGNGQ